jgi:hypothetical protein
MTAIDGMPTAELPGRSGLGASPARWTGLLKVEAMAGGHAAAAKAGAAATLVEERDQGSLSDTQNVFVFVIEVTSLSADRLCDLIARPEIKRELDAGFGGLKTLHFASMTVFTDERFDPTLVLEANFDGPPGPFWADLETAIGPHLRNMLRFCKRPTGLAGDLFDTVTLTGSRAPIAPLLEALAVRPTAVHQGNRGASRLRIQREADLFIAVRREMGGPRPFPGQTAQQIHQALRRRHADHPALTMPPIRLEAAWLLDVARLIAFIVLTLVALNVPGVLLAWVISPFWAAVVFMLSIAGFLWTCRKVLARFRSDLKVDWNPTSILVLAIALGILLFIQAIVAASCIGLQFALAALANLRAYAEASMPLLETALGPPKNIAEALKAAGPGPLLFHWLPQDYLHYGLQSAGLGFLGGIATILFAVLQLRGLEQRDPTQQPPDVDSKTEREIAVREDWGGQNHMSQLAHLKPGLLRQTLMRASVVGLGLNIKAYPDSAFNGYLLTVRTIHFAHLTLVSNDSRLLFLANFDGTWDNYLVDFIEKVHNWLTLVWTHGLGFPPTRFLVFEGATHGRQFTVWHRRSMAPTLYWYRAYPTLSVEQVRRQARIAAGLRKPWLGKAEAASWAMDL